MSHPGHLIGDYVGRWLRRCWLYRATHAPQLRQIFSHKVLIYKYFSILLVSLCDTAWLHQISQGRGGNSVSASFCLEVSEG